MRAWAAIRINDKLTEILIAASEVQIEQVVARVDPLIEQLAA
jgi:hypothetical protein